MLSESAGTGEDFCFYSFNLMVPPGKSPELDSLLNCTPGNEGDRAGARGQQSPQSSSTTAPNPDAARHGLGAGAIILIVYVFLLQSFHSQTSQTIFSQHQCSVFVWNLQDLRATIVILHHREHLQKGNTHIPHRLTIDHCHSINQSINHSRWWLSAQWTIFDIGHFLPLSQTWFDDLACSCHTVNHFRHGPLSSTESDLVWWFSVLMPHSEPFSTLATFFHWVRLGLMIWRAHATQWTIFDIGHFLPLSQTWFDDLACSCHTGNHFRHWPLSSTDLDLVHCDFSPSAYPRMKYYSWNDLNFNSGWEVSLWAKCWRENRKWVATDW